MKDATLGQLRLAWMEETDDFELVQEECDRDDHGYALISGAFALGLAVALILWIESL